MPISAKHCPGCGSELPQGVSPESCPKCLLQAAFRTEDLQAPAQPARDFAKGLPQPGEQFGHYHLVRVLGQGGMGIVYEAEDLDNGRRVALKLLAQALDSPEARKRFLREGRIAASINHPNSVYVFGTDEIAGTPVIAMEFLPSGTLADRVSRSGPLKPSEAVDCMLQVIAGLEAAQRAGILHRDIKPSNCFIDSDGTIKIGDFGLSISSAIRTEPDLTPGNALFGTPAFSSPEQLRGEELTVRSDIYSVGVTLYYLLAGRKPFEGENVVQLLAAVLERGAPSPDRWRKGIPKELCRVVLRCLEKNPDDRFDNYARLRAALLPYASTATTPATLALRFMAGGLDISLLGICSEVCQAAFHLEWTPFYPMLLLYFTALEGGWGATIGKRVFRLRVVTAAQASIGIGRAFLRTLLFAGSTFILVDLVGILLSGSWGNSRGQQTLEGIFATFLIFVFLGLAFSTARRRNGFAALYELLTRTRTVSKSGSMERIPVPEEPVATTNAIDTAIGSEKIGPYHILQHVSGESDFFVGYDTLLLRKVWIRKQAPGTPAVTATIRNLSRPSRLRWLSGKRSQTEAWDAYEAADGRAFVEVISTQQRWEDVRFWLMDLANELEAAQKDGSIPQRLALEDIWITRGSRAKLLDFPAPTKLVSESDQLPFESTNEFLRCVAISALQGGSVASRSAAFPVPLPLHARAVLDALESSSAPGEVATRLKSLLARPASVSRLRRLGLFISAVWFPLFLTGMIPFLYPNESMKPAQALYLLSVYGAGVVILPSLIAALLFRGGALLRGLGICVVTSDGRPASRWRVFLRNLVAGLPFISFLPLAAAALAQHPHRWATTISLLAPVFILSAIALLLPDRSLQDRICGTHLVPR